MGREMWFRAEFRVLSPVIGVSDPVPFDEALIKAMLLAGKVRSWKEGHSLLPVRRIGDVPLISVPFPIPPSLEGYTAKPRVKDGGKDWTGALLRGMGVVDLLTRRGVETILYEMGAVKPRKFYVGTGPLRAYRREYRRVCLERVAVFMDVEEGGEKEMKENLSLPLWIGKKGKFGFGRLELVAFYPADDEVESFRVQGHIIRPLPIDLVGETPYVLYFRRKAPYWRMDEREVMGTNVPDAFDTTLEEVNHAKE